MTRAVISPVPERNALPARSVFIQEGEGPRNLSPTLPIIGKTRLIS
jgi:hypothetical protein